RIGEPLDRLPRGLGELRRQIGRRQAARLRAHQRWREQHERAQHPPHQTLGAPPSVALHRHVRPPDTRITELGTPKSSSPARGAAGSGARSPSTRKEYRCRPGVSGTSTVHVRPSDERRIGIARGFQRLKSPTSDTREAYGATRTNRTVDEATVAPAAARGAGALPTRGARASTSAIVP